MILQRTPAWRRGIGVLALTWVAQLAPLATEAWAAVARKSASPPTARKLKEAERAVEELEYDKARDILLVVIASPRVDEDTLIDAHLLNGIVQRVLENDVEARLSFVYVLERRPDLQLPADLSPKVINFFELVRSEVVSAARPAQLLIETQPPGARVQLDAEDVGVTPVVRPVAQGWHDVTISARDLDRAHSFKLNVEAVQGKETAVRASLFQRATPPDQQEAYLERKAWHNVLMAGKLIGACLLVPSCGCCVASNPLARGDLSRLDNYGNLACLPVAVVGLLGGVGLGIWGGTDLWLGPQPPPERIFHRVEIIPPLGHGTREETEITVDIVEPRPRAMGF